MAQAKTDYSLRHVVDPFAPVQRTIDSLQSGWAEKDRLALAQQEADRKKQIFDMQVSEANRKRKEEEVLSKLLQEGITKPVEGTKKVTSTRVVKGPKKGNEDIIAAAKKYNTELSAKKDLLNKGMEAASMQYTDLLDKYTKPKEVSSEGTVKVVPEKGEILKRTEKIPGSSTVSTYYVEPDGTRANPLKQGLYSLQDMLGLGSNKFIKEGEYRKEHGNVVAPTVDSEGNVVTPGRLEALSPVAMEDAHKKAMDASGLSDLISQVDKLGNEKEIPKLKESVEAITEQVTKNVPYTKAEKDRMSASSMLKSILGSDELSGSTKLRAIKQVKDIFPSAKPMKISEQLSLQKYQDKVLGDAKTVKAYKEAYPDMPNNVTDVNEAKVWVDKYNKRNTSKNDFVENMYNMIGKDAKDAGDIDDFDAWLIANEDALNKYSKKDLNRLSAKINALYRQESDMDITDFLGGSAMGDVLEEFNLVAPIK